MVAQYEKLPHAEILRTINNLNDTCGAHDQIITSLMERLNELEEEIRGLKARERY